MGFRAMAFESGTWSRMGRFLAAPLSIREVIGAMAHELGHWKRQHCQASALAEEEAEFFSETLVKSIGRLTAEHFRRAGMKSMYDIHLDREVV